MRIFFFFQAEDGIRDIGVTGVQTCALPISTGPPQRPLRSCRRSPWRSCGHQETEERGSTVTATTPTDGYLAERRRSAELMAARQLIEQVPCEELDAVVRVAAAVAGVSYGTVNLLDETVQHQLSCAGFTGGPTPREGSLC